MLNHQSLEIESFGARSFDVCSAIEAPREFNSWLCFASANPTNQLPLLKRLWGNDVSTPLLKASQLVNMCKKDTKFGGEGRYIIIKTTPIAGVSASFAQALANQDASNTVRMFVTHRKAYAVWSLQNDVIERTQGNANAVLEALKSEVDSARYAHARMMARFANGHGGGTVGQFAAAVNVATTSFTFRTETDVLGLEPGMKIWLSTADGSAATASVAADVRGAGLSSLTIASISGYTVTTTAAINTIAGATANDWVSVAGNYAAAMTGLRGYLPDTAPTAGDNFMGLDRSTTYVDRVAGYHVAGNGQPKLQTLEDAGAEGAMRNLSGEMVLVANPRTIRDIRKELGSEVIIEEVTDVKVGFKAIKILMQNGTVTLLSEPDAPTATSRLMRMSDFWLRSTDTVPKDITGQQGKLLVDYQDDARQGRLGAYGNFFHEEPGECIIITW
jgi:hypothetical protein